MKTKLVMTSLLSAAALSSLLFFNNCGKGFDVAGAGLSSKSLPSTLPPVGEKVATTLTSPSHVANGRCSLAINIDKTTTPTAAQPITVPAYLADKLYSTADCSGPALDIATLTTDMLPLSLYFQNHYLFQKPIYVEVNGLRSNEVLLTSYKEQFTNIAQATGPIYYMSSSAIFSLQRLDATTNGVFTPTITRQGTTPNPEPFISSIIGFSGGLLGFSRTALYSGTLTIPKVVTSVIDSVALGAGNTVLANRCYVSMNEVFCFDANNVYAKIALPPGDVQDITSQIVSAVCAVVSGKVYCWKRDGVVGEVTQLGADNTNVAVIRLNLGNSGTIEEALAAGTLCSIQKGKVQCLVAGQLSDLGYTGATSLWSQLTVGSIIVSGKTGGQNYVEVKSLTTNVGQIFPVGSKFDEIYPLFSQTEAGQPGVSGCGRQGINLLCWSAATADLVVTVRPIATNPYDIQ